MKVLLIVTNNAPEGVHGFLCSVGVMVDQSVYFCNIPSSGVMNRIMETLHEFRSAWPCMSATTFFCHERGSDLVCIGDRDVSAVDFDGIFLSKVE